MSVMLPTRPHMRSATGGLSEAEVSHDGPRRLCRGPRLSGVYGDADNQVQQPWNRAKRSRDATASSSACSVSFRRGW